MRLRYTGMHQNTNSQVLFDGFTRKKFADRTVEGFAVFKDGIVPEWEDPENKNGGEWSIRKGWACLALCRWALHIKTFVV